MTALFAKTILSIPSYSRREHFFIQLIKRWCSLERIEVKQDAKGNLYLTKGCSSLYPCLCSHLDTVHRKHVPYIDSLKFLPVKFGYDNDRLYIDGMGIGADCKCGVAICLSVMKNTRKPCKCVLFVEEEIGMLGSRELDVSFFDDVSYVLSWDSPGGDRATRTSSGVLMFTDEFFGVFKDIYARAGITSWRDEPYTDIVQIARKCGIQCINCANGGSMMAHTNLEDASLRDMNRGEKLCLEAISKIPCNRRWTLSGSQSRIGRNSDYYASLAIPS